VERRGTGPLGEYGFSRWAWDEGRLPDPTAMLSALSRRGYKLMVWSSAWMCGTTVDQRGSDHGIEAQMLGFLAPGSTETPKCHDTSGTSLWRSWIVGLVPVNTSGAGCALVALGELRRPMPRSYCLSSPFEFRTQPLGVRTYTSRAPHPSTPTWLASS